MDIIKNINIACRFILEIIAVISVAYCGFKIHSLGILRYAVGIAAPLIIVIIWSIWGAPMAIHRLNGIYLLSLEIIIFGTVAACLYASHHKILAATYGIIIILNSIFLYLLQ